MSWRGYLLTSRRMFPPGEFPCKWMHPFLACRFPAHLTSRNSAPSYRGHSRVNTPPLGRPSCVLTLPLSHDAHMLPSRPEGLFVISAPARERGTARHTAKRLPIQEPLYPYFYSQHYHASSHQSIKYTHRQRQVDLRRRVQSVTRFPHRDGLRHGDAVHPSDR